MSRVDDMLNPGTIHLQGVGRVPAIPARDLKIGMRLSWNYSYRGYRVTYISDLSKEYIEIEEKSVETGVVSKRRLKKDRLVAAEKE